MFYFYFSTSGFPTMSNFQRGPFQLLIQCRSYATKRPKYSYYRQRMMKRSAFDTITSPKDDALRRTALGGSPEIQEKVQYPHHQRVATTGHYSNSNKQYTHIKERIPEFVVPDLKDFKLKPYVPWGVEDISRTEFTAKDLFMATYAKQIKTDFESSQKELIESRRKSKTTVQQLKNIFKTKKDNS